MRRWVERIGLPPVQTDRFVEEDARPARPEHDLHFPGGGGLRLKIDERLTQRFVDLALPCLRRDEAGVAFAPASAVRA